MRAPSRPGRGRLPGTRCERHRRPSARFRNPVDAALSRERRETLAGRPTQQRRAWAGRLLHPGKSSSAGPRWTLRSCDPRNPPSSDTRAVKPSRVTVVAAVVVVLAVVESEPDNGAERRNSTPRRSDLLMPSPRDVLSLDGRSCEYLVDVGPSQARGLGTPGNPHVQHAGSKPAISASSPGPRRGTQCRMIGTELLGALPSRCGQQRSRLGELVAGDRSRGDPRARARRRSQLSASLDWLTRLRESDASPSAPQLGLNALGIGDELASRGRRDVLARLGLDFMDQAAQYPAHVGDVA